MKYEIVYTKNEELLKMEKIAKSHGYKKAQDCYWVQIFEDTNGNHIVMTREDGELLSNPCDRLEAMLEETAAEEATEEAQKKDLTPGTIINKNGATIDFEAALMLMDIDIMHELDTVWYDNDQDYFTAYEKEHLKKYGEEWELSKANPTY